MMARYFPRSCRFSLERRFTGFVSDVVMRASLQNHRSNPSTAPWVGPIRDLESVLSMKTETLGAGEGGAGR